MNEIDVKNKPIVVFSNFWHVNYLLGLPFLLCRINDDEAVKINLKKDEPLNYSVCSIALTHPKLDALPELNNLKSIGKFSRLDCFCPTYDLLMDYKKDKDWKSYCKRYTAILRDRKDKTKKWIASLQKGHIYFLCCWENTSGNSHCHRQLIYDALKTSKSTKDSIYSIYYDGSSSKQRNVSGMLDTGLDLPPIQRQPVQQMPDSLPPGWTISIDDNSF